MSQRSDQDHQNLSIIVTKLMQRRPIQEQLISNYTIGKTPEISTQIGLMLHLYNKSLSLNHPISRAGQFLHLKGLILGEFSKNLKFPDPISHFVEFRYSQFQSQCQNRNLNQLSRHSKGIYPRFNCQNFMPLQFLPLYKQIRNDQQKKFIFGNRQWQTTRFVIQNYFSKKIATQIQWSHTNTTNNIVRLFYAIILSLDQQIDQYIDFIKSQNGLISNELQALTSSIKIWYKNYKDFVRQGINMYLHRDVNRSNLFAFECDEQDRKDTRIFSIIQLIKDLVQQNDIISFNKSIKKIAVDIAMCKDFRDISDQYMLLSLCEVISSNIGQDQQSLSNIYREIDIPNEYFDRIFLTEREILRQYEEGKVLNVPKFKYKKEMMEKIYRSCFQKNSKIFLDSSLKKQLLEINPPSLIVDILSRSESLGETKGSEKHQESDSQKILNILDSQQLQKRLKASEQDSIRRYGRGFMKNLENFKSIWKKYHKLMKDTKDKKKISQFEPICSLIEQSMRVEAQLKANAQNAKLKQEQLLQELKNKKDQKMKQKSLKKVQEEIKKLQKEMQEVQEQIAQLEWDEEIRLRFRYPTDMSIASENMLRVICQELNKNINSFITRKQASIILSQKYIKNDEVQNEFIELIENRLINKFVKSIRKQSTIKKKYWAFLSQLLLLNPPTIKGLMDSQ